MKNKKAQKGFTLVEMLISLALFMAFLGILFNAFSSVVSGQKDATAVREMYSGARDAFTVLTEDIRLSTVDYYHYKNGADSSKELALLSNDGLSKSVYSFINEGNDKRLQKTTHFRSNLKCPFTEKEKIGNVLAGNLEVKDFEFLISPSQDPYSIDSLAKHETQLQPMVTLLAEFESADKFTFPLQASVSSRVYSKLDERDRISFGSDTSPVSCEF